MGKCLTPFYLKDMEVQTPVPCGKCPECKNRRASSWSFRLMKEYERAESGSFVTLTYENPPISPNGFMTLKKSDLQKFFKRLRKLHDTKLKYYAVGEYGSIRKRPHYHIILFNAKPEFVQKAWGLGFVYIGSLTEASVGYTLKYMCKDSTIGKFRRDDREREKSFMSKNLGSNYLTEKMVKWHKDKPIERVYAVLSDGKKIALPRYYRNKIYNKEEAALIMNQAHIQQQKIDKQLWDEYGINLPLILQDRVMAAYRRQEKKSKQRKID